jgi:hypothetical protein
MKEFEVLEICNIMKSIIKPKKAAYFYTTLQLVQQAVIKASVFSGYSKGVTNIGLEEVPANPIYLTNMI